MRDYALHMPNHPNPLVGIVMGSKSDWAGVMEHAWETLNELQIPAEKHVRSAHRTADLVRQYAREARTRGIEVIIAGADGAAHLPGMTMADSDWIPVLGVPVGKGALKGMDALLSIVQMPAGVPVGAMSIGKAGAINAALLAGGILVGKHPEILDRLRAYSAKRVQKVLEDDREIEGI
jgi:5-(carboxyamino)imidazole ribonucleotide mutase